MGPTVGAIIDLIHALALLAWVAGLPLLFFARSERLRRAYAIYAFGFIVLSWASRRLLGACFLTRLSTALWQSGSPHAEAAPETWFTVRFAEAVFHLRPREDSIVAAWYLLVLASCVGFFVHLRKTRPPKKRSGGDPRQDASSAERDPVVPDVARGDRGAGALDPVREGALGAPPLSGVRARPSLRS